MQLAILKAGTASPEARAREGDYDRMFVNLLARENREFTSYDVEHGEFPNRLDAHQLYLVTGSRYSAYDDLPWIKQLLDTLRELHDRRIPLAGVCFGHQAIAQALGGRVERNPGGWEVGVRPVTFTEAGRRAFTNGADDPMPETVWMLQSHQDAVLEVPPGGENLASGPRTPSEVFRVDDHVLGVQGHPEFRPGTVRELIETRRDIIPEERAAEGLDSLRREPDQSWAKHVLESFLSRHGA